MSTRLETRPATAALALQRLRDWLELTKPRCMLLVLVTAAVGFVLGSDDLIRPALLINLLLGTALCGGGSIAVNQFIEHRHDRLMDRTRNRPIASGRISPEEGLAFALAISFAGFALLLVAVNPLTALLAAITWISYTVVYTPLKRVSSVCTLLGALPGAIPPMMGWTAVRNEISAPAWVLFCILFLWQMPHFSAIAWLYRRDYTRAGFQVMSVGDELGRFTRRTNILYTLALIPVSLAPSSMGITGPVYFFGALVLGLILLVVGARVGDAESDSPKPARRLLVAGSLYLVLLLGLMIFDRI